MPSAGMLQANIPTKKAHGRAPKLMKYQKMDAFRQLQSSNISAHSKRT